jgi:hypothetical protein
MRIEIFCPQLSKGERKYCQLERQKPPQEDIQEWPHLDEVDHGFLLLTEEEIAAVIFIYFFPSVPIYIIAGHGGRVV